MEAAARKSTSFAIGRPERGRWRIRANYGIRSRNKGHTERQSDAVWNGCTTARGREVGVVTGFGRGVRLRFSKRTPDPGRWGDRLQRVRGCEWNRAHEGQRHVSPSVGRAHASADWQRL